MSMISPFSNSSQSIFNHSPTDLQCCCSKLKIYRIQAVPRKGLDNKITRRQIDMNIKVVTGSIAAVGLLGIGVLAGGVVGSTGANAQTPPAQTPAATATPGTTQP